MTVLQEDPASFQDLGLGNQLLGFGSLATPQGDHVHVEGTATLLPGKPHQLGSRVHTYSKMTRVQLSVSENYYGYENLNTASNHTC